MQDSYVGDIGDYGKYGLLRAVCAQGLSLSVNWYRVAPKDKGLQDDGKYIQYLSNPIKYREYDPALFDALHHIVMIEEDRRIERIEQAQLFPAQFYAELVGKDRVGWHRKALEQTRDTDTIFLDPDNGLETQSMFCRGKATEKHVKWTELCDYYTRGQNVILYQHRPQMTKKEVCIEKVMQFQKKGLIADGVLLLEFPKYTNRYYFIFYHKGYEEKLEAVCAFMAKQWGKDNFCKWTKL